MKQISKYLLAGGIMLMGFTACEKNLLEQSLRPQTMIDGSADASIKVVHAFSGKAPALVTGAGPSVFLYWGAQKLNGSTALGYTTGGGFWPAPSTSTTNIRTLYGLVPAGANTLRGVMARVTAGLPTPAAGDTVFSLNTTLAAGKYYTAFLSDTLPSPQFTLVEDNFNPVTDGKFKLRFANFIAWNDVLEVFSKRENKVIFSNVGYKKVTDFIELNVPAISDTLTVTKVSGNSPTPYTFTLNSFKGQALRGYTLFTKGKQVTGTSVTYQNISLNLTSQW